jgi:hypothetical protein
MTMQFTTGSSTTFNHCAVKKCLYHATPGGDFCKKHKNFEIDRYHINDDGIEEPSLRDASISQA